MSTKMKLQLAASLIFLIILSIVVYQNRELLTYGFPLNLFSWHSEKVPNAVYLLSFFLLGALSVFVVSLRNSFRSRSTIQSLQDELAALKGSAATGEATPSEALAEIPPSA
ncbi:MAG: LapA family protein [Deltaproteobacteria bacterium]|nr:LapA family protein [Deltaproteobacteria bacterium]